VKEEIPKLRLGSPTPLPLLYCKAYYVSLPKSRLELKKFEEVPMRDRNISKLVLDEQLSKSFEKVPKRTVLLLESEVVDSSNFHRGLTVFRLRSLDFSEKVFLAIASWYLPESIGIILRLDLEESFRQNSLEDQVVLRTLVFNKSSCLEFLLETTLWHSRDFFGNIVSKENLTRKFPSLLSLAPLHRKVKKLLRKRGYNDHGSRVPDHRWKPKFDYSLTELQLSIEIDRKVAQDTLDFIRGLLE